MATIVVGTRVYVRNRFTRTWCSGFSVAEVVHGGYLLRRLSDGYVFPDVFPSGDVNADRRSDPARGSEHSHLDRR